MQTEDMENNPRNKVSPRVINSGYDCVASIRLHYGLHIFLQTSPSMILMRCWYDLLNAGAGIGLGFPGLQVGFGAGAGCGVGVGFGYGLGKGRAYDDNGTYSNIGRLPKRPTGSIAGSTGWVATFSRLPSVIFPFLQLIYSQSQVDFTLQGSNQEDLDNKKSNTLIDAKIIIYSCYLACFNVDFTLVQITTITMKRWHLWDSYVAC